MRALIFDFDGLILETEGAEYQSWRAIYDEYGVDLPVDLWSRVIGSDFEQTGFHPVTYLAEQTGLTLDANNLRAKRRPLHHRLVEALPVMPGVKRLITAAQTEGLKLGVASSSSHAWVDGHLKRLGLFGAFDAIRCRDDVDRIKPAPDVYLAALAALGVPPGEAVVLEDSANGVRAAAAAGIKVVAVPHALTAHSDFSLAARRIDSLKQITLQDLKEL